MPLLPAHRRRPAAALLKHPVRYKLWTWVSKLNANHARYAWLSLFSVALVDLYIYLLATGVIDDPRFF